MGDEPKRVDGPSRGCPSVALDGFFLEHFRDDRNIQDDDSGSEDDEERTRVIIARTEWGQMTDFLKANPYVTRDEYLWEWTVPQIRLASYDYTHVEYLSEKEIEKKKRKSIDSAEDLLSDLGTSIFTI